MESMYMENNRYDYNMPEYDSEKKVKDPCCTRCVRSIVVWVNVGFSVLAIIIISVAVYGFTQGSISYIGKVNEILFALSLSLGVAILLVSTLGCVSARSKNRCLLIVYLIGLVLALFLEIAIACLVFNETLLKRLMQQRWEHLSDSQRSHLEKSLDCCDFDTSYDTSEWVGSFQGTTNDTIATLNTECEGCYYAMRKSVQNVRIIVGALTIVMICYECVMFVVTTHLLQMRQHTKERDRVPDDVDHEV
ncbi:hypothetical protein RFI_25756 [Reticulomyxa filosa]|uniref:Uncharacterized protein n=1 Tax=Reticulomyxa filosa TaxID=46433 RepID=X6MDX1_RETFI|nr:hypothetical protein RFI_25756 [Reticulomyxa filosa]|eukprot:ETO11622.1 hypothetical protein RFI_25756 [Reticulomyxa filosa]